MRNVESSCFIEIGYAWADGDDSFQVGYDAASRALAEIAQFKPTLVIVFASVKYDLTALLSGINQATRGAPLIGTTTAGELCDGVRHKSVVVTILASPYVTLKVGIGRDVSKDWRAATEQAADDDSVAPFFGPLDDRLWQRIQRTGATALGLLFSPGNTRHATSKSHAILELLRERAHGLLPIVGGSSADDWDMDSNYVLYNTHAYSDSLLIAVLETQIRIGTSMGHGFQPTKMRTLVTNARENQVETLDNRPAGQVLAELFGYEPDELVDRHLTLTTNQPLGVATPFAEHHLHVASYLTPSGGVLFTQPIPEGTTLSVMQANPEDLANAAGCAVRRALMVGQISKPSLLMVISCALRYQVFGSQSNQEVEALSNVAGSCPLVGFLSFGEQGIGDDGSNHHGNELISVLVLGSELNPAAQVWLQNQQLLVEREQLLRDLNAYGTRVRAAFDKVSDGIVLVEPSTRKLVSANSAFCRMMQYSLEELLQLYIDALHPTQHFSATLQGFDAMAREELSIAYDIPVLRKDGSVFNADIAGALLKQEQGSLMLGIFRNMSEECEAEAAYRANQERLRMALYAANLGTWDWNLVNNHFFCDQNWLKMLGYGEGQLEPDGHTVEALLHPEERDHVKATFSAHLAGLTPVFESEHRLQHQSGDWIWVLDKGRIVERDQAGIPTRACGTTLEITDRKRSRRLAAIQRDLALSIAASSDLASTIAHALEAAISVAEMDCGGIYLFEQQTGDLVLTENLGLSEAFVAEVTRFPADNPRIDFVKAGRPAFHSQHEFITSDRNSITTEGLTAIAYVPIVHAGEALGTMNIASHSRQFVPDFARFALETIAGQLGKALAHLRAVESIQEAVENLRTFFDTVGDLVFVLDLQGTILSTNQFASQRLGYQQQELIGSPFLALDEPEGSLKEALTSVRNAPPETHRVCQGQITTINQECLPIEMHLTLGRWNRNPAVFCVARDMTERVRDEAERQRLQERIEATQRLEGLGVLAGGIAHDFNNLLMGIMGNVDLALIDLSPLSPVREFLHEVQLASRRAADLCRQMLAYAGRGKYLVEVFHLRELVEEMVHLLRTSLSKKILLNLNLEKNLPPLLGDSTQLRQVIMNIVINASEAIGDLSGVITISTGAMECSQEYLQQTFPQSDLEAGLYVYIEISDTGCGMDENTQLRIFEPFFTTKFSGRGLGMSAVLGIVRSHKGALRVYSELETGTTFKILLPAMECDPDKVTKLSKPNDDWRGEGLVLLVDDEETVRAIGKRMLERLGFQVITAADGREALHLYRIHRQEIALVLLDLTMPRMNGEETYRELRSLNPQVCVVLSSGYTEREIDTRFSGKGLAGFVQKPYKLDALRATLQKAEARKRGHHE